MIETFDDLYDAMDFIENLADEARVMNAYFKAELVKTNGRWRVGIQNQEQLELDI